MKKAMSTIAEATRQADAKIIMPNQILKQLNSIMKQQKYMQKIQ